MTEPFDNLGGRRRRPPPPPPRRQPGAEGAPRHPERRQPPRPPRPWERDIPRRDPQGREPQGPVPRAPMPPLPSPQPPSQLPPRPRDHGLGLFSQREGMRDLPPRRARRFEIPPDESPTELIELADPGVPDPEIDREVEPEDEGFFDEDLDDEIVEDESDESDEETSDDESVGGKGRRKPPSGRIRGKEARRKEGRGKESRHWGWLGAVAVILLLAGGIWYGIDAIFGYDDYDGTGESDVLVQIADGDSTNAIAAKLARADVVASPKAFVNAGEENAKLLSVQPGYYQLKTKMSGANAVVKLVSPQSRVGEFQLRPGTQLDDLKQPDGKTTDGVLSQLMKASCADLNGNSTCVSIDDLRKVAETGDLAALGVPDWLISSVSGVDPKRRLEGLIQPGVYDVKPGWDATQLLTEVLKDSAKKLQTAGLPDSTGPQNLSPYQTLIVASLIEREAVQNDFSKVSAVIYNRLAKNMKMEFDSTINYVLDRPVVRTKPEDRARAGAYNTYQNVGLPPTPIASPSKEAIAAAEKPSSISALFFVKCEKNGLSCFADTNEQHEQNVRDAQARGAY